MPSIHVSKYNKNISYNKEKVFDVIAVAEINLENKVPISRWRLFLTWQDLTAGGFGLIMLGGL